jgi:hypothetical protein
MRWNIILQSALPDGTSTQPSPVGPPAGLGPRSDVAATLAQIIPEIEFTDLSWDIFVTGEFSIEFDIGEDDHVSYIMLQIRGSDAALDAVRRICEHTGWRAFDTSMKEYIDFDVEPAAMRRQGRAFRGSAVASYEAQGKNGASPDPEGAGERKWYITRWAHEQEADQEDFFRFVPRTPRTIPEEWWDRVHVGRQSSNCPIATRQAH